ncbi:hypothetical protein [Pseudoduganella sp.]|uniref:hypothetical protein n=1 Tax=Pseudoduganella sp. TaxID=1880898 RepID=UPI0035AE7552
MHQYTHSHAELAAHDGHCPTCGQPWPEQKVLEYGNNKPSRWGIAFTVGLHLLVVAIYLFKPADKIVLTPPAKEGEMVYLTPPAKPTPKPKPLPKAETKASKAPQLSSRAYLPPSKTAITEVVKPQERIVPPEEAKLTPPPPDAPDMATLIEMRRRARGVAPQPEQEQDPAAVAKARAIANIMGAQGRSANGERNDTGGVFQIVNQTFNSAEIKFRGFSTNFKRQWLQQVRVEQGTEKDIETAIVKRMIEMIRKEKPGDFIWESHRLGRNVPMSARKEHEKELEAFLLLEFFPNYGKVR